MSDSIPRKSALVQCLWEREQQFQQAFQLAHHLHPDALMAAQIAAAAVTKLPLAQEQQHRRLRYDTADSSRTRVYADDPLLLLILVFQESEPYEMEQERALTPQALEPSRLALRFVKHLVLSVLKRNSFYAAVGICRILYRYTTAETIKIYDYIAPNRSEGKEPAHYRRTKAFLMRELSDRFGDLLNVEFSYESGMTFSSSLLTYNDTMAALSLFAPRRLEHTPPSYFDVEAHRSKRQWQEDGDEPWNCEMNRFHALIDPLCFEKLTASLGLDPPWVRVATPRFITENPQSTDPPEAASGLS